MTHLCSQHQAGADFAHAERATAIVLALTVVTMVAEIAAGWWSGSMALLTDGWHMAMHAAAMGVAFLAYRFVRRQRGSTRYSFGAGKAGDLGAFANAVMLGVVALLVAGESLGRLVRPDAIDFGTALIVATIGFGVNVLSAWLLRAEPHGHGCGHAHADHNREAAFLHVAADALTSALAILALYCGRQFGLTWLDPLMGVVGAALILRWSLTLARRSSEVLLDAAPASATLERIHAIVAEHGDELHDLHVWPVAAGRFAATVGAEPTGRDGYRSAILALPGIDHLTLDRSPRVAMKGDGAHACCTHGPAHAHSH